VYTTDYATFTENMNLDLVLCLTCNVGTSLIKVDSLHRRKPDKDQCLM